MKHISCDLLFEKNAQMFSSELYLAICAFAGDWCVIHTLKHAMTTMQYDSFFRRRLIYGEVQSGKTAKLIEAIKTSQHSCIIVIQNSTLLKLQFLQRCLNENVEIQCLESDTDKITKQNVLLLNNKYHLNRYKKLFNTFDQYTLLLDESDITYKHPLRLNATIEIHCTATPFTQFYKNYFDRIDLIKPPENYVGIKNILVHEIIDLSSIITDVLAVNGMLLINNMHRVEDMMYFAENMSITNNLRDVPIIVLVTKPIIYLNGISRRIKVKSLGKLIDGFNDIPLVIVSSRMSSRGVSYVNSARTRHITHQISSTKVPIISFIQKCRLFGIYKDQKPVHLYVNDMARFNKYKKYITDKSFLHSFMSNTPTSNLQ